MNRRSENLQRPKLAIIYAYIITFGSVLGLICFTLLYFTDLGNYIAKINVSPILLAISMFIFSALGLLTGSGLLSRKKYGWILAQFLLIYILVSSTYNLIYISYLTSQSTSTPFFNFIKFFLIFVCGGIIILYFNQKEIIKFYGMEPDDANRIYLISIITSILILFFSTLL